MTDKTADLEDINFNGILQSQTRLKARSKQFSEFTFFLDEPIGSPSEYRDEIHTIVNASEIDTINIIINSPGGQLSTAQALVEAIKISEATINAVIMGECSSAATIIALNCPNVIVLDSAEFMIHTAKFGSWGNTNNVKDHVDFNQKQINKLIDATYTGFLTKQEIEKVKLGVEFWFDAEETRKRLENRIKFVEKEEKKKNKKASTEDQQQVE